MSDPIEQGGVAIPQDRLDKINKEHRTTIMSCQKAAGGNMDVCLVTNADSFNPSHAPVKIGPELPLKR